MGSDLTPTADGLPSRRARHPHSQPAGPAQLSRSARYAPALVAGALAVAVLVRADTPPLSILAYALGTIWQIVVPGTLVYRALASRSRSWTAELAMGSVVGLIVQLLGWFVMVGLGLGSWLVLWPLAVLIPFVVVPSFRGALRRRPYPVQARPLTAWSLSGAFVLATVWLSELFEGTPLPPSAGSWYQDLYYHLSLSGMFMHQVTPMTPQVAGEPLRYHWFANAHMAASALGASQDMPLVMGRLFILPIIALTIAAFVALLVELTEQVWPAVVASFLTIVGAHLQTAEWFSLFGTSPLALYSPSQVYSLPIFLVVLTLLVRLLRQGRLIRGEWVLLTATLVLSAGAKSSSLPMLICALALAFLVTLWRRQPWRPVGAALLLSLLALVGTLRFAGGSAGTGIQLFSTLRRTGVWAGYVQLSEAEQVFPSGPLLPGLSQPGALVLLILLLLTYAVMYAWLLPAAAVLRGEHQAIAALLLGVGIAGWAAMMLIDHDGMSQVYFMNQALVAWHALTAWGFARVVRDADSSVSRTTIVGAAGLAMVVGSAVGFLLPRLGPDSTPQSGLLIAVAAPIVLVASAVACGAVAIAWARRTSRPAVEAIASVALATAVLSAAIAPQAVRRAHLADAPPLKDNHVTAAEVEAARWLRSHSEPGDVIATNVHCQGLNQAPGCDARAFWVSGFSERPVLIEGWAYTDAAHRAHGAAGLRYWSQPFEDPELFALNEAAFVQPSQSVLDDLAGHGVRWLFADTHRAEASSDIARYADEVFRTDDVIIYSVRTPHD